MMDFSEVKPEALAINPFRSIRFDWLVLTAGTRSSFNSMTACWGGFGHLWDDFHVCLLFVRPSRYTFGLMESCSRFTVQMFTEDFREQVLFLGKNSGRDVDKVAATKLTPVFSEAGCVYYQEAETVFFCEKLYFQDLVPQNFVNARALGWYADNFPEDGFHRMYVGGIFRTVQRPSKQEEDQHGP